MNTYRKHITIGLSFSAFAFSSALLTAATRPSSQQRSGMSTQSQNVVQVATEDADRHGIQYYLGNELRGANGQMVGTIKDFIIETDSGKITFAVVSSGGVAGIGDTLRLVPFESIKRSPNTNRFTTSVQQSKWETLPVVDERNFKAGRVNITPDQRRQLAASYSRVDADPDDRARYPLPPAPVPGAAPETPAAGAPVPSSAPTTTAGPEQGDFGGSLVRASTLKGKSVRSGTEEVGEIDDVVINFDRGIVTALIDTESEFSGPDEHEFLVPFSQLQLRSGEDSIATRLTRADFQRAQPGTSSDPDERLTPTGRPTEVSTDRVDATTLKSAARAIKQMWDAHPELAKLKLRVSPENGKLVFSGSVPNAEVFERAKDTAESVVRGIPIDNRIAIEPAR